MTIPTAPPPAADATDPAAGTRTPHAASPSAERFFLWFAGLGIARSDGWLGGIAAGIAARLRIDPLIVRGVLVIAALFGLPVIFLYALAWALLPDADGRIHARDLLNRDFQPVQLGILGMAVVGLIPTAPLSGRLFGLGYESWSALSVFGWIAGLVVVGGLLFLIVRAASRTPDVSASSGQASPDSAAPGASATLGDSGTAEGAGATPPLPAVPAPDAAGEHAFSAAERPIAPTPLPASTQNPEELAAWRAQHAAWREQDQAWRRQQQDAERAARDQLRRERQAAAATFATEAAERRRLRRASNPRASFAFVASAMGLALVVGAAVGLTGGPTAGALGLLSAALVLAVGMIVAGLFRRRSGFLAFLTILTLAGGVTASSFATFDDLTLGWASVSNVESSHVRQPFGDLNVTLLPHDDAPRPIVIDKGTGQTWIDVQPGVELELSATLGTGSVTWMRTDPDTGAVLDSGIWPLVGQQDGTQTAVATAAAENTPVRTRQPVTITQTSGDVRVIIYDSTEEER
ncbi:PspC domain-containing protein [Microbacterium sp. SSW1-49]|uniref:PspC domain-containing protein n=1 Tax=Microbacterium croceum TaxID=2851645 RepID=A0ABT0FIC1_9MICO|nr:PspC domain-containing protein [Microbacterium croceum]MCK2037806.1 PspC domain-containing protein [Microbacterium croceum]